jgi:acyl-coenzyme A synthetase/AMP-(fatty) acid ligase
MVVDRIYEWGRTQPNRAAVIHNDTVISYGAFAHAIDTTYRRLEVHHLPVGRTAVVLAKDLSEAWILVLTLRCLGLNTICVQSLASVEALKIRDLACVVTPQSERLESYPADHSLASARVFIVPSATRRELNPDNFLNNRVVRNNSFGGHILYTSGTTGSLKKVLIDGSHEERRNIGWSQAMRITSNSVHHGLNFGIWTWAGFNCPSCVWHVGGTVVFDQTSEVYSNTFKHEITSIFTAPSIAMAIMDEHRSPQSDRKPVDFFIGAGSLSAKLYEGIADKRFLNLTAMYGFTENHNYMNMVISNRDDIFWLKPPIANVFDLVDEHGNKCIVGEEGQLRVKLGTIDPFCYHDDFEASLRFFRNGYFYPGDLAVSRADGCIRILGRASDVLNIQGHKIAIAPLEQQIQQILKVGNVCLFAGLDEQGSEELVVVVEANQMPPRQELEHIASSFRQFQRVRFEVMKAFPRTETGMQKVNRIKLRQAVFGTTDIAT